jgi:hypothetical protein
MKVLSGKVIFLTGGCTGIGLEWSVREQALLSLEISGHVMFLLFLILYTTCTL